MFLRPTVVLLSLCFLSAGVASALPAATVLSRCTDIRQSGFYTLDRDITGSVGAACMQIRDVSDVHLDCHGHSITADGSGFAAVLVQAANNFTVTGCVLPQLSGFSLFVGNSVNGDVIKNVVRDVVINEPETIEASSLRLVGNHFSQTGRKSPTNSSLSDETEVVPVASGVNWMLARHMSLPDFNETAGLPGIPTVAAPEITPTVYPNPWRADRSNGEIHFAQLPPNSTIKIFTVSAHWVRTLHPSSASASWDLRNDAGEQVASGIYLYAVTNEQGQKAVGQLAVIR